MPPGLKLLERFLKELVGLVRFAGELEREDPAPARSLNLQVAAAERFEMTGSSFIIEALGPVSSEKMC